MVGQTLSPFDHAGGQAAKLETLVENVLYIYKRLAVTPKEIKQFRYAHQPTACCTRLGYAHVHAPTLTICHHCPHAGT